MMDESFRSRIAPAPSTLQTPCRHCVPRSNFSDCRLQRRTTREGCWIRPLVSSTLRASQQYQAQMSQRKAATHGRYSMLAGACFGASERLAAEKL
jgi:hypothetical protein